MTSKVAAPPSALAPLQEALAAAGSILADTRYGGMRPILAVAALKELAGGVEKLIHVLEQKEPS